MTNERLIIREAIVRRYSVKKVFLKILQFHGETPVLESATLLKETSTQIVSCEYCKNFKNIYFEEHLRTV